jgi:hypothetical protein
MQTKWENLSLVLLTIGWAWGPIGIIGITIGIDTSGSWLTDKPRDDELIFIIPGALVACMGAGLWIWERKRAQQGKDL